MQLRLVFEEEVCALPEYLYTCSLMMTLVLRFCYFDANVVIAWKFIKSIKLKWIVLSNDHIMNLLLGFSALEAMELSCFKGMNLLLGFPASEAMELSCFKGFSHFGN